VGSVFDLSNARVAKILNAKVVIVTQGGIGKPIDEVCLNQALFEKEGVEVIGVILNKVVQEKVEYVADFARRGLKRKGLELLGVIPHRGILSSPTLDLIKEELNAESLNNAESLRNLVSDVVVGAMGVHNTMGSFKPGVLIITPGDREDIILAAATTQVAKGQGSLAGIVLTGDLKPNLNVLKVIREMPFPVLFANASSYEVSSKVHDLIVKTRASDTEKIALIRDLVAENVDLKKILTALG
jgi:BioD-like phosphotransacetylase family protein